MKKRFLRLLAFLLLASVQIVLFQNCDSSSELISQTSIRLPNGGTGGGGGGVIIPRSPLGDQLVSGCLANTSLDACLFYKNPTAQLGYSITSAGYFYDVVTPFQNYAVTLRGLDTSGNLQNLSIAIQGPGEPGATRGRYQSTTARWRVAMNAEADAPKKSDALTQVGAYYWLNRAIEQLESSPLIGDNYVKNKNLLVYPYTFSFDGEDWQNAAFVFGPTPMMVIGYSKYSTSSYLPLALSGDVVIHEFGHAQVHFANSATDATSGATTQVCGNGLCCKTSAGCMRALNEGIADWLASTVFPENPALGDGFENRVEGFTSCGGGTPYRDARKNTLLTSAGVYAACVGYSGEIYTMATLLTSMLWEIRATLNTRIPALLVNGETITGAQFSEAIVFESLLTLSSGATYGSMKSSLKSAAAALKSNYSLTYPAGVDVGAIIDAEFARRGL